MRRLIINADDLGYSAPRSHGVFVSMEHGAVSSATLIPNMGDSDNAARRVKERGFAAGLHLNLSEGSALTPERDVHTLLDMRGYFLGREKLQKSLQENAIEQAHLEREIRSQIEWFFDHCGAPTHVDGHHHMHVHPQIAAVLAEMLPGYGIRFVRIPAESISPFGFDIGDEQAAFIRTITAWATEARPFFDAAGIGSADHFRGMALLGNASAKNLRHVLSRLPEGTTELMVHPGSPNPLGDAFETAPQRQTELQMLTDPGLKTLLIERGLTLCSYGDL